MKKIIFSIIMVALSYNGLSGQVRAKLPNDFGMELAGKSLFYSFSCQHVLWNMVGLQGGISVAGVGMTVNDHTITVSIPVGLRLYLSPGKAAPFVTCGIVLTDSLWRLGFYADRDRYRYFGIGFEYRQMSGILVRGSIYCLQVEEFFLLWPGIHVGYAF